MKVKGPSGPSLPAHKGVAPAEPTAPPKPIAADAFGGLPRITGANKALQIYVASTKAGGGPGAQAIAATSILVANEGGGAVALDPTTGAVVARFDTGKNAFGALFSPDGTRAFTTDTDAGTVSEVEIGSGRVLSTLHVGKTPRQPQMTRDGRIYIPLWAAGEIAVVDASAGGLRLDRTIMVGKASKPHVLSMSPDEKTLWCTVRGRDVRVLSIALHPGGEGESKEYRYDVVPRAAAATNDGVYFTAHHSLGVHYVSLKDGEARTPWMEQFGQHSDPRCQIEGVCVSPNGKYLAIAHEGRKALVILRIEAPGELKKRLEFENLSHKPYWVAFDVSSKVAFVSLPDAGTVEAYDLTLLTRVKRPIWTAKVGGGKPKRMVVAGDPPMDDTL